MLAVKSTQPMGAIQKRPLVKGYQTNNLNMESSENTHLEAFLAAAHRRKYPAKSTLIYAGDKSDSIYYITKGSVTVLVEDESGREIIVAYLNKGDFFGEMPLFFDDSSRSAWRQRAMCRRAMSSTRRRAVSLCWSHRPARRP